MLGAWAHHLERALTERLILDASSAANHTFRNTRSSEAARVPGATGYGRAHPERQQRQPEQTASCGKPVDEPWKACERHDRILILRRISPNSRDRVVAGAAFVRRFACKSRPGK